MENIKSGWVEVNHFAKHLLEIPSRGSTSYVISWGLRSVTNERVWFQYKSMVRQTCPITPSSETVARFGILSKSTHVQPFPGEGTFFSNACRRFHTLPQSRNSHGCNQLVSARTWTTVYFPSGGSRVLQVFLPVTIPAPNTFFCVFLKARAAPGSSIFHSNVPEACCHIYYIVLLPFDISDCTMSKLSFLHQKLFVHF